MTSILALAAILLQVCAPLLTVHAAPPAQTLTAAERAQALLDTLLPEERVGQLFLVNFTGLETNLGTDIYDLIINHHVGGVVLRADHNNFIGPEQTADLALELTRNLQQVEWLSTQRTITNTVSGAQVTPAYIPLFIGINQPGDGAPYDQILSDLTQLPSPEAIGATWDTSLAERAGLIAGQELTSLGINLLLGPSLDVLEDPDPESRADLGVRSFGGDPFWVAQMGSAYIRGVHTGGDGRIAVIGKHFPGVGGADRPLEEEVSTVRKSLEQLKQIELAPFFYVTGDAPDPESAVDGLLISHIRYQGFLGNIRATTRPVSFDEASFLEIMNLAPFAEWRSAGGIMISDDLGSRAVRRFYDPSGLSFNARLVVRDAFLAGNDMLYLGDILDTGDPDFKTTAIRILEFFTQKYREDQSFAQRVDVAVLRILTLKFEMYDTFALNEVIQDDAGLAGIGNSQQTVLDIARAGATLISPSINDLNNLLPDPPGLNDRIVFITDTNPRQQCADCAAYETLPVNGLEQAIIRLYGPDAGNQVQPRNLYEYSFFDLSALLDASSTSALEADIRNAGWIVFSMQDVNQNRPESLALRRLLAERDDLIRGKNVIVFAFNAPYFLDATDIVKLTAYYALYSKTPQAVETAARILFKEFIPDTGASPVSVSGIGYDLIQATSPNPNQLIEIRLVSPEGSSEETEEPPAPLEAALDDHLVLETGRILDHNGNPVPDGTPVQFVFVQNGVETIGPSIVTANGVARTTFTITVPGTLLVGVLTEPRAQVSQLEFAIPVPEGFLTPSPSEIPTETDEAPTPAPSPTPAVATPEPGLLPPRTETDLVDWLLALLVSLTIGLGAYRLGSTAGLVRWSIRWGLTAGIGGLLVYMYLALGMAGTEAIVERGRSALIWMIAAGAFAGWGLALVWYFLRLRLTPQRKTDPPRKKS